ncbi:hypothetical protein MIND_00384200 [Mycena indigotica]|uniref:Enoyl-CoA hydratase/isomerase family protein n=1 Tax=Mycena indigotica TaxID=2126181 RepID=A0A8H6W8Y2_9AGAR|nr:uncharacterized protein MIND_00384200 [Mycena indigotica]KAF7310109.1 hypothetical protein MIND_00384200 [Mycena indigotica]
MVLFFIIAFLCVSVFAAQYPSFGTVKTSTSNGVMHVVLNNTFSEINLLDAHLAFDLANLIARLQVNGTDSDIHVVVFSSANPHFFIAHSDINIFVNGFQGLEPLFDPFTPDMGFLDSLFWNITQLPQATIAIIEGRARAAGNEFLMACDMRFALSSPEVRLAQTEPSVGGNPGTGGGMYLSNLINRGRTFEYLLSATDIDADTAAQIGWVNRVFKTKNALYDYVDKLAKRIAIFPLAGIAGTKQGINAVSRPPRDVYIQDAQDVIVKLLIQSSLGQSLLKKVLKATNNQSIGAFELDWPNQVVQIYK